jgi:lipoprotein NlpD
VWVHLRLLRLGVTPRPAVATTQPSTAAKPAATPAVSAPAVTGKAYTVKRGDTLYAIALEQGLSYRDLAAWNGLANPNYIQADQVLRLTDPAADTAASPAANSPVAVAVPVPSASVGTAAAPVVPASVSQVPPVGAAGDIVWGWPSKGKLIEAYTEGKSKGIGIGGVMGEPVFAAADGKVVYAGSALKGYGPMLIIKHNETYITAYAHNSKLLVKEEQTVKRGQHIADMGNAESDNGKVKLHFELRRNGKPQDPSKFLPK